MSRCPIAHKSCAAENYGHTCWKNPGHKGPHSCICYLPWETKK